MTVKGNKIELSGLKAAAVFLVTSIFLSSCSGSSTQELKSLEDDKKACALLWVSMPNLWPKTDNEWVENITAAKYALGSLPEGGSELITKVEDYFAKRVDQFEREKKWGRNFDSNDETSLAMDEAFAACEAIGVTGP